MAIKLKTRQIMGQPKSYGIIERAGDIKYKLFGACAASVPLGKVLNVSSDLSLNAGPERATEEEIQTSRKRDILKQKIIDLHGYKGFKPKNILFTNGTYEANFLVLSEAVESGDEIVMMRPCWYQFAAYNMEERQYYYCCGGLHQNVKVHLLTRNEEANWKYDIEGLQEVVSNKTALIVVNSPDNPTGNVCNRQEMRAICEIAEDYGAFVLHDEIYRGTEWDEAFSSEQAVNCYDRAAASNSVSKTLGFDGLRLGWLATRDKKLFERCRAVNEWLHMGQYGAISNVQLEIGLAALERKKFMHLLNYGRGLGKACWDEVDRWMSRHRDIFNWIRPMAAFLSFPSYKLEIDSWKLCEMLAAKPYHTAAIPGIAYGMENHLRIGVGRATPDEVRGGMEQIGKLVSDLS
jgi:aspartate/methionine/tyrosine aminotransferase